MQEPDLHHYDRKLKSQIKSVRNAKISERDKGERKGSSAAAVTGIAFCLK